jgi:hypothetical protein
MRSVLFVTTLAVLLDRANAQGRPVTYSDVKKFMQPVCGFCHNWEPAGIKSRYYMSTYEGLMDGTIRDGVVRRDIIPGDAEHSPLIEYVEGRRQPRMPIRGGPLPEAQIQLLRRWIDDGAKPDEETNREHRIVVDNITVKEGQTSFWMSCRAPRNEQQLSLRAKIRDQATGKIVAYEWPGDVALNLNGRWSQWKIEIPNGSMKLPGRVSAELSVTNFLDKKDEAGLNGVIFLIEPKQTQPDQLLKQKNFRTIPDPANPPEKTIHFTYTLRAPSDVALIVHPEGGSAVVFAKQDRDLPPNQLLTTDWDLRKTPAARSGWYSARLMCTSRDKALFQPDMAILFTVTR